MDNLTWSEWVLVAQAEETDTCMSCGGWGETLLDNLTWQEWANMIEEAA